MELKEFVLKVKDAVSERLGEGYRVEVQEIRKNNNVVLQGLLIHSAQKNVSPTIYLDSLWDAYEKGVPFVVIFERIMWIYHEDTPKQNIDMGFFQDFKKVKDRVCFRVISAESNEELLKKIPYVQYLDLAICFYYAYQSEVLGNGAVLIYNSHMEMWNSSIDELYDLAERNTPRLFPEEYDSMENVIRELLAEREAAGRRITLSEEEQEALYRQVPIQVLTNSIRVQGAACILYPEVLAKLAEREEKDLYIIPSSIHEIILLPKSGIEDTEQLKDMIREVNATQVDPEEILSNSLYCFERLTGQIKIV